MQRAHIWRVVVMATLFSLTENAAQANARRESVALTVYNQNFALVKDVRVLDVAKGRSAVRLDDVAAFIDPTSVHCAALDHPDAVSVLEQNYQYDLADANRLLARYLDHSVMVSLVEGGGRKEGTLLSQSGGDLVLRTGKGASIVNRRQIRDIALGDVPGGLVVRPALAWTLASQHQGPERIELSYLTDNVTWHAEYVAVVNSTDDGLTLNGWVSLDNKSGASFADAKLKLVAGDVNRVRGRQLARRSVQALSHATDAIPQFEEREFFEYHIYELERPATVADRETKQLALFPSAQVTAQKKLTFEGSIGALADSKVAVRMEFRNSKADGLGMPLPQGKIRVYKKDADGAIEFVGEDNVDHTPRDEPVRLFLGNAFDVVGEKRQADYRRLSDRKSEALYAVEIRNHKDETVEVAVIERLYGDRKITQRSHEFTKKDARTVEFPVTIPPNESVTVTYTVESRR